MLQYYIVETAENIPYDVMPVQSYEDGVDYMRRVIGGISKVIRTYYSPSLSYAKWIGLHDVEYCLTLILIEE